MADNATIVAAITAATRHGDVAWTLTSTALVFIMIPGVGYFYSGMARSKNALSLIMLGMLSVAVVSFQ
ncbi:6445_t:CDS:1, partial [Racocetra persica]